MSENSLYFFSSVVSPQNAPIKSIISHSWEKYNIVTKKWEEKFSFNFPIYGNRLDGYRGHSLKTNIEKGEWRVRVLADDRVIGTRKVFVK